MIKAILHYRAGARLRAALADNPPPGWTVVVVDEADRQRFIAELPDTDVLLHVLQPVTRDDMARAPRLKLIQKIGVGTDTIDLTAARELGIGVANMPGTNSQAVAEIALGLMLSVLRQIPLLDHATRDGKGWALPPEQLERSGEIAGRTIGLVGFGEVPRRLTAALIALGATVIYHDLHDHAHADARRVTLDDLLAQADIVSLHVPLVPATAGMIDAATIARMKDDAILINTARGGLVNEADLAAALASGKLMGAGLDVLSQEPAHGDNPLLALPNVVVTPHIAWLTPETIARSLSVAVDNGRRAFAGDTLLHEIVAVGRRGNPPAPGTTLSSSTCSKEC